MVIAGSWRSCLVILATQEAAIRRIEVQGEPDKSNLLLEIPFQQKSWVWWCTPVIPASGGVNRRMEIQASLGPKNMRPSLKKIVTLL
jgi:hypothetical protein